MSVNIWFSKTFNAKNYTCMHFACDVWKHETGNDLREEIAGSIDALKSLSDVRPALRGLQRLQAPQSPCLAVFRPRLGHQPHIGVWIRGKVLHLTASGVQYQPLHVLQISFHSVRFYR